ncbi:MAG: hypothetical protein ABIO16_05905 [Nocardioides sp.]
MPSSTEVLAAPPPRRRPFVRAVVVAAVVGLGGWGLSVGHAAQDPPRPAAHPPALVATVPPRALPSGPPPGVRYPSRLEGRWVVDGRAGHLFLVIHDTYLDLWQGVGQQQDAPTARRFITVLGDRVFVRSSGDPVEAATYRWQRGGGRLTFDLVEQTPEALSLLDGLSFSHVRE